MEGKAFHLQKISLELSQTKVELEHIGQEIETLLERQEVLERKKQELEKQIKTYELKDNRDTVTDNGLDWSSKAFSWTETAEIVLKEVFNIAKFRKLQRETINATLSGVDCILLMPTGAGKSLCFQLPAVFAKGITLVISPLISLIQDQIIGLKERKINATNLSASSTKEEINYVHDQMTNQNPELKLLYVTPEKLAKSKRFMSKLEKCYQAGNLERIVIDEVHCISQWGHDFRPDYKRLGILKRQFPNTPFLGLTATATTDILEDIKKMLRLEAGCLVLRTSFNRPNLFYEVHPAPSSDNEQLDNLANMIKNEFQNQSGIIYCFSRNDTERVASELTKRGINGCCYHAWMASEEKALNHRNWIENKIQVIVATVAFGMGIDKPDVRFVIHYTISKSIQNYYQESGRAGRNDDPARCIVFYKFSDVSRQMSAVFADHGLENLYPMVRYCNDLKSCRRSAIGRYFGEDWGPSDCNGMCDNCRRSKKGHSVVTKDITQYTKPLITIIENARTKKEKLTPLKLVEAWLRKGKSSLRVDSVPRPSLAKEACERVVVQLVLDGVLKEDFHFTPFATTYYIVEGPRKDLAIEGKIAVNLDFLVENPEKGSGERTYVASDEAASKDSDFKDFKTNMTERVKKTAKKRKSNAITSGEEKKLKVKAQESVIILE